MVWILWKGKYEGNEIKENFYRDRNMVESSEQSFYGEGMCFAGKKFFRLLVRQ